MSVYTNFDDTMPMLLSSSSEIPVDAVLTDVQLLSLNPVSSSDANGLKALVLDLIGDYDAIVVEYEYTSNNGYQSYLREVQYDFPWLVSAGIFAIVLYCTFRMGAKILCSR